MICLLAGIMTLLVLINACEDTFYIFTTVFSHRTSCSYMVHQHRSQALLKNFQVTNILYYSLWTGGYYTTLHNLYLSFHDQWRINGRKVNYILSGREGKKPPATFLISANKLPFFPSCNV